MQLASKTIVFAINSLTTGGAERALIDLLTYMEDRLRGYNVHLVLLDIEEEQHLVPPWVKKHVLDAKFSFSRSAILLTRFLREMGPAISLSFLNRANCANVIASRMVKRPCIISERGHTTSRFGTGVKAEANKCIMRLTYPRADQVIAVSQGIRDDLIKNFAVPETKIRVIYNPVNPDRIRKQSLEPSAIKVTTPYIVGVGRLVATKKFDLLIEAYRLSGVSEKLVILGDGSCRQDLERLVSRYRLSTRVILPGHVQNPYPIIQRARLFVSSSIAEGFPNALIEAMALGCPVVATDCDTGPIEILTGQMGPRSTEVTLGEYGILVPVNSIDVLAQAIRLGCREDMRALYSQRGQQRARHFGVRDSVDQYWALIAPYIRAT